jgi:hypothetical protein
MQKFITKTVPFHSGSCEQYEGIKIIVQIDGVPRITLWEPLAWKMLVKGKFCTDGDSYLRE